MGVVLSNPEPDSSNLRADVSQKRTDVGSVFGSRWELIVLVLLITGVALLLRLVNLTSIPTGLHGDEAIVGMEGQRVLREGLIDPYSPSALGQPTAPFYLAALTVWIWENTVFAVRISAVIFGTLAIPALYLVVRRSLGVPTGLLSASLLTVLGWHIHYSRIAFPLPAWPLWVILTVGAIAQATRSGTPVWWAVAGAMSGAGIYVYNAHPLTLLILCLFVGGFLASRWSIEPRDVLAQGSAFAGALLASLLPMFWFVLSNYAMYSQSITRHSVRDTDQWQQLDGPLAQAGFVLEEYLSFWSRLSFSPEVDSVDATGITAVVPHVLLGLGLAGMILALVRIRSPIVWLGTMLVLLMPFATVLTEQGEMRRTLVIAPFLAMFSAIGILEVIKITRSSYRPVITWIAVTGFAVLLGAGVSTDLRNYFYEHGESETQRWIFAEEFYDASMHIQELPDDTFVYFMSERWSFDYQPRRFLAPDAQGTDRSDEFGRFGLDVDRDRGRPVFILVGQYRPVLDALQQEYPDGEVVAGSIDGRSTFVAYTLPD